MKKSGKRGEGKGERKGKVSEGGEKTRKGGSQKLEVFKTEGVTGVVSNVRSYTDSLV